MGILKKYIGLLGLSVCMVACADRDLQVTCDNPIPESQATFDDVYVLFTDSGAKGCAGCHSTSNPTAGYDLSSPSTVYDALSNQFDRVYAQVVSGNMPKDGTRWSSDDIDVLRSWYCYGGFFD